jgi:hypothetical protein
MVELHWKPSKFVNLEENERATVMAFIDYKLKEEKKATNKMKKKK